MATIGTIDVALKARTKKFQSGMKRARKSITSFAGKLPGVNMLMGKFGAIMSGAALVGVGLMVKKQMEAVDTISKLSDELGISTETLVGWGHAAGITGTSAETVHKSVRRMVRTIGEANQGMSSGITVFKELGLEASAFAGLEPEEAFYKIVQQINGMSSAADKAAVAYKMFGRGGQDMLNMITQGEAGIKALVKDADDLGLAFSRVEGYQIEAANDALNRMGAIFTGIWRKLAIKLAPMIEHVAKLFVEWGKSGGGIGKKIVGAVRWIVKAVGTMIDVFNMAAGAGKTFAGVLISGLGLLSKAIAYAVGAMDTFITIVTFGLASPKWGDKLDELADGFIATGRKMADEGIAQFEKGWEGKGAEKWLKTIDNIVESSKSAGEEYKKNLDTQKANNAATRSIAEQVKAAAEAASKHADEVERLRASSEAELTRLERIASMTEAEKEYGSEIMRIDNLRVKGLNELADRYQTLLDLRKADKKAAEDLSKFEEKVAKQKEALVKRYEQSGGAAAAAQDASRASQERIRDMNRELEVLRAATEGEKKRITLRQEYEDLIKRAGDSEAERQAATLLYQEKLNGLKKQEAEAAKSAADSNKASANSLLSMAQQMKKDEDVTQTFKSPGGGGLFGFGKGRVGQFAQFFDPGATKKASPAQDSAKQIEAASKAAMDSVPDITKNLDILTGKIEALKPIYKMLNDAVKTMGTVTVDAVRNMRISTATTVQLLARGQEDLRSEVSTLKTQLDYALDVGLGGE